MSVLPPGPLTWWHVCKPQQPMRFLCLITVVLQPPCWLATSSTIATPASYCVQVTGKLQNLPEISWFAWVFGCFWRFCVLLFELEEHHHWKKCISSDGLWMVPKLVTHMKRLHTCLTEISPFVFSQQTKIGQNSPVDLLKLAVAGNLGLIESCWIRHAYTVLKSDQNSEAFWCGGKTVHAGELRVRCQSAGWISWVAYSVILGLLF